MFRQEKSEELSELTALLLEDNLSLKVSVKAKEDHLGEIPEQR